MLNKTIITLPLVFFVTLAVNANHHNTEHEQAIEREQTIAKNNVWHQAKLRGVSFRALGQEPSWLVEIFQGKQIVLKKNYNQDHEVFPYVEPTIYTQQRRTIFKINNNLTITIDGKPCMDSMSGEQFSAKVTISYNSQIFKGCGRALH